ncbi:MAG: hypothetical protein K8F30_12465 [Taibaiella sp.]|nr:hypothetical protein [Taibaiella sp.]
MKWLIILGVLLYCHTGICQQYRLSYDSRNIPELYDEIELVVQQSTGNGGYKVIKNGYTIQAETGTIVGKVLKFDRAVVQRNAGILNFTLTYNKEVHNLTLTLPVLTKIRFNLYADSIKPVLNYYLNVEGVFSNGKTYPLDASLADITPGRGTMQGMEWIKPAKIDFDKVSFVARYKYDSTITAETTVYIKKGFIQQ